MKLRGFSPEFAMGLLLLEFIAGFADSHFFIIFAINLVLLLVQLAIRSSKTRYSNNDNDDSDDDYVYYDDDDDDDDDDELNSISDSVRLMEISESLTDELYIPVNFPIKEINNEQDYKYVWRIILYHINYCLSICDFSAYRDWAYHTVRCYTKDVLRYGTLEDERMLRLLVMALEVKGLIPKK